VIFGSQSKIDNLLVTKLLVVGVPTHSIAILTGQISYEVPKIAMTLTIANSIESSDLSNGNRVDKDGNAIGKVIVTALRLILDKNIWVDY